jgi:DNA-binding transcriptional regulator YiaG
MKNKFTVDMVKPLRDSLDLTQDEFAAEIGCGSRSVSKWETGKITKIQGGYRKAMILLQKYQAGKKVTP